MGASLFMGLIVFVIVFIFAWPFTRKYALGYVAIAIGVASTVIIKMVVLELLRGRNFSGFYRKMPRCANYANLFFECWYLAKGLFMIISRCTLTPWNVPFAHKEQLGF